jgi:hypothetical protein
MDAWGGIIGAMKGSNKSMHFPNGSLSWQFVVC